MRLKKSIKRGIAAVTITGIMASSAMPAFAKDYHIDYGDIKVDQDKVSYTDKDGTKYDNEKNEDGDITITGKSDENTVSVKDADVTFKDLEIDRSASSTAADGAAVSVSGNSSIELDGKNTISSGMGHAGIEKADDNGTMTIKDDNNVSGSLTANGGFGGAGIGGGNNADGSDITITGGNVTANGGGHAAGIGGGSSSYSGGGNGSDITISGGNVTANGGTAGAGIGGGDGDNANGLKKKSDSTGGGRGSNITISGKNTIVNAEGGAEAAGIGGGRSGDADTIEITDSTVISNGHDSGNGNSGAGIGGGGFGAGGCAGGGASNITIKDADVTAGADAGGAGIGSGRASGWISYPSIFPNWKAEHPNEGVASDITISGGRVKASGGDDSAGIGGGYLGSGSDITIKDNADVTANGGKWGAGIGGGRSGDGSDISISDSNVSASGGAAGAGIGGGRGGKGENVTISGSSTVSVKHGPGATLPSGTCYGAGSGIGNGGGKDDVRGEEIAPDISGIDSTGQGYINYYDSDNNLLTRVPSAPAPEENDSEGDDAEPALSASMKQAVSQLEVRGALRQNLMQDTSIVQQDYDADAHVLTIRAELSIATLTGTLGSLKALQAQGVTTIAFVTQHCTSTLDLAELTALGGEDTVFSLVHTAGIPALSVGGALHNELIH
ncbi:MAG: hypothetical protein EGQ70_01980 [Faecalibacterium prausnitzii]|nr:hypothetical protein [Faecalibacterium prausnitzii]